LAGRIEVFADFLCVLVVVVVVVIELIVVPRILSRAKSPRFSDYDHDHDHDNDNGAKAS